jgi:hypothetical protein
MIGHILGNSFDAPQLLFCVDNISMLENQLCGLSQGPAIFCLQSFSCHQSYQPLDLKMKTMALSHSSKKGLPQLVIVISLINCKGPSFVNWIYADRS